MEKVKIEDLKNLSELPKGIVVKHYIDIKTKYAYASYLVDQIVKLDDNDLMYCDVLAERIVKKIGIIEMYTNIELSDDNYKNYDILMENKFLTQIEDLIGEGCADFYYIIDELVSRRIDMNNSVNSIIAKRSDDMVAIFNRTMNHVDGMLDKGDPNKIAKYLSKGIEMVASKLPDLSKIDVLKRIEDQVNKKGMN